MNHERPTTQEQLSFISQVLVGYSPEDWFSCDETALYWKKTPERDVTSEHPPQDKLSRAGISLLLCCNATGSHKFRPSIVNKQAMPRCFELNKINPESLGCKWRANTRAWMDVDLFAEWLQAFDTEMAGRKFVLIMDRFSAHFGAVNKLTRFGDIPLKNTQIVWLPVDSTKFSQPLTGIINTFKALYRRKWHRFMLDEHSEHRSALDSMDLRIAVQLVVKAWRDVTKSTIRASWEREVARYELRSEGSTVQDFTLVNNQAVPVDVLEDINPDLRALQTERIIREAISLEELLNPLTVTVHDSGRSHIERLAERYRERAEAATESDEELQSQQPDIVSAKWCIDAIARLRLYEQQQVEVDESVLVFLDDYQDLLRKRHLASRRHKSIIDYFAVDKT